MSHDDETLRRMAEEHVIYELRMAVALSVHPNRDRSIETGNALLESYLLHCRNLGEFLFRAPGDKHVRPTDVTAGHYFDDLREWNRPTPPASFDKQEIDRRVAHLTTHRLTGNQDDGGFNWAKHASGDRTRWALSLKKLFGRFLGDLGIAHPDRAAWFAEGWANVHEGVANTRGMR